MNKIINKWKDSGLLPVILWFMVGNIVIWLPINRWVVMVVSAICLLKVAFAFLNYILIKDDRNKK